MTKHRTVHVFSLLLFVLINLSCNRATDSAVSPKAEATAQEALVIRSTQSPADGDSREPELTATYDGRVILSWVEKVSDKGYALRLAMLDQNGWSEPRTVSQGENWFVNWADFPSVAALRNGTLAAHWLVKSGSSTYAYDVMFLYQKMVRVGASR